MVFVFCPSKKAEKSRATKLNLKIGAQEISEVDEVKFLGVTIDNQLKFKTHFQHVTKKVRSGLAALTFTKHILNYTAKRCRSTMALSNHSWNTVLWSG
jgi:hypothetical protein